MGLDMGRISSCNIAQIRYKQPIRLNQLERKPFRHQVSLSLISGVFHRLHGSPIGP